MTRVPPLNWLKAFEAAARHSSVSAGARSLNVTTSAVSQHVKRLEEALGIPLMWRDGNRVRLSDAGREMALRLAEAFALVEQAVEPHAPRQPGEIRIVAPEAFARGWLMPSLAELTRSSALKPRLVLDEPDIEIVLADAAPEPEATRLIDVMLAAVCSPDYAVACTRGAAAARPTMLLGPESARWWPFWLQEPGAPSLGPPTVVPAPSEAVALEAARLGLGLALAPACLTKADIAGGRLVAPFATRLRRPDSYWGVARGSAPAARRLLDRLAESAAEAMASQPAARRVEMTG